MGRKVGGTQKHVKQRPTVIVKTRPNLNTAKHPKVYRPKQVLTKKVQHHGAAYGVHRSPETRVRQQQHRNLTVKIAKTVGYPQSQGRTTTPTQQRQIVAHKYYKNQPKVQHQIQKGTGQIHTGTKPIKRKVIKPRGAGERPITFNPFGLW